MKNCQVVSTIVVFLLSSVVIVFEQDSLFTQSELPGSNETSVRGTLQLTDASQSMVLPEFSPAESRAGLGPENSSHSEFSNTVLGAMDARELFPLSQLRDAVESTGAVTPREAQSAAQATILRRIIDESSGAGQSILEHSSIFPTMK